MTLVVEVGEEIDVDGAPKSDGPAGKLDKSHADKSELSFRAGLLQHCYHMW